ncbi:hypothetical protein JRO89_XS02G0193900 [Xanthoceras sorbifolium]|uniref:Uncharacterized protein n=1 Tax=Xanthoceras sorbifolium TaxID=99658 RepID=A0ABQ8IGA3_9ROSI|nr:hypothetical protein JRO89_XS02G0193900 [Xanthoceras sorbifolium]
MPHLSSPPHVSSSSSSLHRRTSPLLLPLLAAAPHLASAPLLIAAISSLYRVLSVATMTHGQSKSVVSDDDIDAPLLLGVLGPEAGARVQHPTGIELVISPPTYNVQYPPMGDLSISVNAFNAGVNASANVEGQIYLKASNPHGPPIRDVKAKDVGRLSMIPLVFALVLPRSPLMKVAASNDLPIRRARTASVKMRLLQEEEDILRGFFYRTLDPPIFPLSSTGAKMKCEGQDAPEDKGKGAAIPPSQDSVVLDEFLTL